MNAKLYVGNLSYSTTEEELRELFGQAGQVKDASLVLDRETRRPRGFAFVEMTTQEEAEKAIQMFNNHELDGRRLTVDMARPREERPGPQGGFNRGGSRDRR